jgi:glucose-1-phosphate thymidylyltransferase
MLPAGTRPILEHILNALIEAGIDELHLVVGYQANRVRSHFGSTYREVPITYHTQANQLGSGHALLQAQDGPNDSFLVVNGDQIIDHRIVKEVSYAHTDATATLAVVEGPEAAEYGALKMEGEVVTKLIEQPTSREYRLFNAGVYAFDTDIFETLDGLSIEQGELPLTDAISQLITDEQTVQGIRTDLFWMDVTHPWHLLSLSRELLARRGIESPEANSSVYVDDSVHIHPDATLVGPVVIDSDVVVQSGAVVGPHVAVGANTMIGADSIIKDVVIDTGTTIGPKTTVIECITGQNCEIGPEVTISGGPGRVIVGE